MYSEFIKYSRKKIRIKGAVRQLFIDSSKALDSVRWEVLYNNLVEFGTPGNW